MKNQASLFDYQKTKDVKHKYGRTWHGGAESKGHRKEYRPLAKGLFPVTSAFATSNAKATSQDPRSKHHPKTKPTSQ